MDSGRSIGGIILTLVIVGGIVGYKFYGKSSAGNHARDAMHSYITRAEGYDQNREYIDHIFEMAHQEAFEDSYRMGSRRRSATFNDEQYAEEVFQIMIQQARRDGSTHIADALVKLRDSR